MTFQIRWLSLLIRRSDSAREGRRILQSFEEWRDSQCALAAPQSMGRNESKPKLLIIRLDDIGDYLLFRNQLAGYRNSERWGRYHVTLVANSSWRAFFEAFDSGSVDEVIWVNKSECLSSAAYRMELWHRLRAAGFETVIAPSRTRPLLLDDLCMLAAAPAHSLGAVNTYLHDAWNRASDALYEELFRPADARIHEFQFNGEFAAWSGAKRYLGARPRIELPGADSLEVTLRSAAKGAAPYVIFFLGATTRSKRWPVTRWIELARLCRRADLGRVIVAGNSRREIESAAEVAAQTGAESIAGRVSLMELAQWVAGASAVVSNDTMAAHLAVSLTRPTVIVANGVNYERFTDYAEAGIEGVATVYPRVFTRRCERLGRVPYHYPQAVSADMTSIRAAEAFEALRIVSATAFGSVKVA